MTRVALALLLVSASVFAADPPKKDDDKTTKVTGTFVVPKEIDSFDKMTLRIELYEYDPKSADKPASSVDKVEVKDFKHTGGKETVEKFEIGTKGMLKDGKAYYLTVYVMSGDERKNRGDLEHDKGLGKVLTDGQPREVKAVARSVGGK